MCVCVCEGGGGGGGVGGVPMETRYISHWFWTCGLVSHFDLDGPKLIFRPQISPAGGIAISLNFVTSLNSLYISG